MRIDVFTLFPEAVDAFLSASLIGRARRAGLLDVRVHDVRAGADDARRSVDDSPFGGGAGMVLVPDVVFRLVEAVEPPRPLLLLSPAGHRFDQRVAGELAAGPQGFSLLCGRYEGVDQRIADHLCDGEISIGDVVLTGGEAAAFVVVEAVARLCPGVLGNDASAADESFSNGLLEYPQWTRPARYRGWTFPTSSAPAITRSSTRGAARQALWQTLARRPDLMAARGGLTPAERVLLDRHRPYWREPAPPPLE